MKNTDTTNHSYPPPQPELIEDIRKRLSEAPREIAEYVNEALKRESIEHVANYTYKAGHLFGSGDLYEYRKTLFPPGSMVDPYTAGPPVLRPGVAETPDHSAETCRSNALAVHPLSSETPLPPVSEGASAGTADATGAALLSELRDVVNRYVVLPNMAAEALALWIVHTYAFTERQVTTYIGVVSPEKRCGKTTLLELLGCLARKAVAAANISPSALFRVIEEEQPTLIIDEADTFLQGRDEMAGILNAGYRKGNSYVVRVNDGKARRKPGAASSKPDSQLVKYSCWCPKVMAAIGRLPETLADRCIVITMQRKMPGEKCERLRDLDPTPYRGRCAEFVEHHWPAIAAARPEIPSALNDRAADIWEPLFAIADIAGGNWATIAREAAVKLSGSDEEMTPLSYFLKDLRNWMVSKQIDRMLSREIVSLFDPVHNRPWEDLRRGRGINEHWLGSKMRALGIAPKSVRFGETTGKGYLLKDIEAAFQRYGPKAEAQSGECCLEPDGPAPAVRG